MKEEGQQLRLQPWTSRELTLAYPETFFFDKYHWNVPSGKRDPRQLVSIQGLFFSGSKMVYPDEKEIEQSGQETCADKNGAPVNTQAQVRDKQGQNT